MGENEGNGIEESREKERSEVEELKEMKGKKLRRER